MRVQHIDRAFQSGTSFFFSIDADIGVEIALRMAGAGTSRVVWLACMMAGLMVD